MEKELADQIVRASIKRLQDEDPTLLPDNVHERTITHRLANYIEEDLKARGLTRTGNGHRLHVDCEYNRNLGEPKRLSIVKEQVTKLLGDEELDEEERELVKTYPDIIFHWRRSNAHNLLVIEVKLKPAKEKLVDLDKLKLKAFTEPDGENPYHYRLGLFVLLGAGEFSQEEPEYTWYRNGEAV